jgi:hypothetical protein
LLTLAPPNLKTFIDSDFRVGKDKEVVRRNRKDSSENELYPEETVQASELCRFVAISEHFRQIILRNL